MAAWVVVLEDCLLLVCGVDRVVDDLALDYSLLELAVVGD